MKSIQVVLIVLSVLATITGSIAFRSRVVYRLVALILFVTAVVFVVLPDLTSDIARSLGVGRGTDLLLYLLIFAGVHGSLLLYMRTRRLERKLTDLVRALAIANATTLPFAAQSKTTSAGWAG